MAEHQCKLPDAGWLYRCPECNLTWRLLTRSSPIYCSVIWTRTRGVLRWLTRARRAP